MISTRDWRITQKVAKISVDQILHLIAGVCLYIICDLSLLKTLPPPLTPPRLVFFLSLSLAQTPHLISKSPRVINTFTPWASSHHFFRAVHATAAFPAPAPYPQRPLLPNIPHHRLDLEPRVYRTPTSWRSKALPPTRHIRPPPAQQGFIVSTPKLSCPICPSPPSPPPAPFSIKIRPRRP